MWTYQLASIKIPVKRYLNNLCAKIHNFIQKCTPNYLRAPTNLLNTWSTVGLQRLNNDGSDPTSKQHWFNVVCLLGTLALHRLRDLRRWPNIGLTLGRCLVFTGYYGHNDWVTAISRWQDAGSYATRHKLCYKPECQQPVRDHHGKDLRLKFKLHVIISLLEFPCFHSTLISSTLCEYYFGKYCKDDDLSIKNVPVLYEDFFYESTLYVKQ